MMFSIIIPNYNSEQWIKKCLDSILNQSFKDFEIIIVDDMSEDNSLDIIREYDDKRIIVYQLTEKLYNGGARNYGVSRANGEYILFLDCDDWLYSRDSLKEIAKTIYETEADLIRLSYVAHNKKDCKIRLKEKNLSDLANTIFVAPWTKCVKKSKFARFPENTLLEDVVQHIAQVDNIDTMAMCSEYYVVWNRSNENAISSDKAKYDETSKRYSSVYRNYADLLDLKCKHDYCEKQRQFRLKNYRDIILKDDVLGLINGRDAE